jgi:transposase-like protein
MPELKCAITHIPDIRLMPACPQCSAQMKIVRVTPTDEGLEDRTFACLKCHHVDTWVFKTI